MRREVRRRGGGGGVAGRRERRGEGVAGFFPPHEGPADEGARRRVVHGREDVAPVGRVREARAERGREGGGLRADGVVGAVAEEEAGHELGLGRGAGEGDEGGEVGEGGGADGDGGGGHGGEGGHFGGGWLAIVESSWEGWW